MNNVEPLLHDDARELLPWVVNGSLAADERDRIRAHANDCVICRRELEELERLRDSIQLAADATAIPAADMQRINGRIDSLLVRQQRIGRYLTAMRDFFAHPWRLAFAAQTLVLIGLVSIVFWPNGGRREFVTLTEPESLPAGEYVRVVFDPDLNPDDIAAIVDRLGLDLVGKPTERGVATLRIASPAATSRDTLIAQLLDQPGVLFAQPVANGEQ